MKARPTQTSDATAGKFFRASLIAAALAFDGHPICKKSVQRRAKKESWPTQREGNRVLFAPPADIAAIAASFKPPAPAPKVSSAAELDKVIRAHEHAGKALKKLRLEYERRVASILRTLNTRSVSARLSRELRNATALRANAKPSRGT